MTERGVRWVLGDEPDSGQRSLEFLVIRSLKTLEERMERRVIVYVTEQVEYT